MRSSGPNQEVNLQKIPWLGPYSPLSEMGHLFDLSPAQEVKHKGQLGLKYWPSELTRRVWNCIIISHSCDLCTTDLSLMVLCGSTSSGHTHTPARSFLKISLHFLSYQTAGEKHFMTSQHKCNIAVWTYRDRQDCPLIKVCRAPEALIIGTGTFFHQQLVLHGCQT